MTEPFGMPTFVKVGKKKTPKQLGAPGNVRPPTEPGQATLPGIIECDSYDNSAASTFDWTLPSNMVSGDLAFATIRLTNSRTLVTPSGWTLLDSQDVGDPVGNVYIIYRIVDGTETSPATIEASGDNTDVVIQTWYLRANGVDFSTALPEANMTFGIATQINPPSLTPSGGADTYWVFAGGNGNQAFWGGGSAPTGYTELGNCQLTSEYYMNNTYQLVDITTAEDPAAYGTPEGTGDRWVAWTIAVKQSPSGASVAPGDHTHVEADVTDLTHTDGDAIHDNVAAEISAVTEKVSPVSADLVLIEDSEASNAKKRVQLGNLPGGSSDHGSLTGLADDDHSQYLNEARHDADDHSSLSLALDGLSDVTITSPSSSQVLKYNGSAWVNDTDATGSGSLPTGTTKGDIAVYDGSSWVRIGAGANDTVLTADSAQTEGIKWAAAAGGGGTVPEWVEYLAARQADETSHADDDFFDDATKTGYTETTVTGTATWTESRGRMNVKAISGATGDAAVALKSITASGPPLTIETAFITDKYGNQYYETGLCFTDGTTSTSNVVWIGELSRESISSNNIQVATGTLTNISGSTKVTFSNASGSTRTWTYFRLVQTAANTWAASFSSNGVTWHDMGLAPFSFTMTPTHFGLFVAQYNSSSHPLMSSWEYLRMYESDLDV